MRKKLLLLLAMLFATLAGALYTPRTEAAATYPCIYCETWTDGTRHCYNCICDSSGYLECYDS